MIAVVIRKSLVEIWENSILLFPILKEGIEKLIFASGFSNINFYGGFNKSELTEDSIPLVIEAY